MIPDGVGSGVPLVYSKASPGPSGYGAPRRRSSPAAAARPRAGPWPGRGSSCVRGRARSSPPGATPTQSRPAPPPSTTSLASGGGSGGSAAPPRDPDGPGLARRCSRARPYAPHTSNHDARKEGRRSDVARVQDAAAPARRCRRYTSGPRCASHAAFAALSRNAARRSVRRCKLRPVHTRESPKRTVAENFAENDCAGRPADI